MGDEKNNSVAKASHDGIMGVIEVDSDACWPLDEKEIELGVSKTLFDATDTESGPQATAQGNEDAREEEHG